MTEFVVLTSPRSGSGWLIDMLNSHPAIVAHAELFHVERRMPPDYGAGDLPYFEASLDRGTPRLVHQVAYLAKLYAPRPGAEAVGFKLTYVQANANPALLPLLSLRRVRVMHLVRANLLATAISWKVARESGIYHVRQGEPADGRRVRLEAEQLRSELEERDAAIARARRTLDRLRLPMLEIAYEGLVDRKEVTLGRILRFLGLEPEVDLLESTLVRARHPSHLERLENADDVRAALSGTRFEWMLAAA